MSNLTKILAAGALAVSMAGTASAATLMLMGGTAGTVPGSAAPNNALVPLGLAASPNGPYDGYYGAQINLVTTSKTWLKFTLLGWEARYINSFISGENSFASTGPVGGALGTWNTAGIESFLSTMTLSGLLDFTFETAGRPASLADNLSVENGSNDLPTNRNVNFFASVVGDPTATSGNSLLLFFDDDGNQADDNHDDLVVRVDIAAVPVPAAGFMLFGALGGLAALRRRRKAA
jgi:hypothetical protein